MKLLGLGDNVMDAYLFRGELYPGGNAANVAVLAKRAGAEKSGYNVKNGFLSRILYPPVK